MNLEILELLQEDGRRTYADIAHEMDRVASTVRTRIRRLEELGFIQRYTTVLDPRKLGLPGRALLGAQAPSHGEETQAGPPGDQTPSTGDASPPSPDDGLPLALLLQVPGLALPVSTEVLHRRQPEEPDSREPDASEDALQGRGEGASPGTSASGGATPRPATPERFLRKAEQAVEADALDDSLDWFDAALALDEHAAPAWIGKGLCLEELGEYDAAAGAFRSAADEHPNDGTSRFLLARAEAQAGRTTEAVRRLAPLVEARPDLGDIARDDDRFKPLHDDPRFLAAIGEL